MPITKKSNKTTSTPKKSSVVIPSTEKQSPVITQETIDELEKQEKR